MSSGDGGPLLRLKDGVEWQRVDGEVVALDLASSAYLGVNETGAVLWPLFAAGTTEPELVAALTTHFPAAREAAEVDVGAFVAQLRSMGLVEEA